MFELSREQKLATLIDRHIAVNANAGSGKTTVLVERLLKIIEEGILNEGSNFDISGIVAITFTRKAAAEMKSSLINKVREIIDNYDNNAKLEAFQYKRIREKLLYANINTIHSFCLNLLKDYPIEAEIEPNVSELSNLEKQEIVKTSINSIINEWYNTKNEKLTDLTNIFDIKNLVNDILPGMLNDQEKVKHSASVLENKNEILSFVDKELFSMMNDLKTNILDDINNAMISVEAKNAKMQLNIDSALRIISELEKESDHLILQQKIDELKKIRIGRSTVNSITEKSVKQYKDDLSKLKSILEIIASEDDSEKVIEISKILWKMYQDINIEIKHRKNEMNSIDFNDMIEKTLEILDNKSVFESVRNNIKYLMVDEFQDTNQAQYDIVEKLVNGLNTQIYAGKKNYKDRWTNLFIVGDKKQSIYSFRSADVSVYEKAISNIKKTNENGIKTNQIDNKQLISDDMTADEKLGEIKFKASHRMMPNLAAFINDICSSAMNIPISIEIGSEIKKEILKFSVEYDELISAKNAGSAIERLKENNILGHEFGRIDIIPRIIEDENEEEYTEEEQVATYIINAIKDENYLIKGERAKFSDFTVLSRRTKNFGKLASEFTRMKIPYVIHSGKGYYQKQEIMDFINMIKFIINKNDDLSLVAVLRSPFFRIEDEQLLEISVEKGNNYWEKFKKYAKNNDNDKIERIFTIIDSLDSIVYKVTISEFIYKIAENTGWYGTVMNYYDADQRKANLDKLIDSAATYEQKGFKGIYDFIDEVELESESDSESEASLSGSGNAVQIMTIHKSKGLGFNVVVLYDINSQNNSSNSLYLNKHLGFAFKTYKKNDFSKKVDNKLFFISKYFQDRQEEEEEKRILYVALTRAKEHIAIFANLGNYDKPKGLLKLIMDNVKIDKENLHNDEKIQKKSSLSFTYKNEIYSKDIVYDLNILNIKNEISDHNENIADVVQNDIIFNMKEIEPELLGENYSATKLSLFRKDTNKYVNKYLLGIHEDNDDYFEQRIDKEIDSHRIDAAAYGTIFHETIEKISEWINETGSIIDDKLQKVLKKNLRINGIANFNYDELANEIKKVANSDLIKNNLSNILNSQKELSLMMPFIGEMLYAQIDLLYKNEDDEYEVWDWKTNSIDINELEKYAKIYETQMKFYAYFIMRKYPEQKSYKTKLLFTKLCDDNNWTYSWVWERSELIAFEKQLELDLKKIRQHDFADLLY